MPETCKGNHLYFDTALFHLTDLASHSRKATKDFCLCLQVTRVQCIQVVHYVSWHAVDMMELSTQLDRRVEQTWSHAANTPTTVSSTEHSRGTKSFGHAAEGR